MAEEDVMRLMEHLSESLQNEMRSGFAELRAEMNAGFGQVNHRLDRVEARLGRHGGLLQGGARQITRIIEWSERQDELLAEQDQKIEDLRLRLEKLEADKNGRKS